MFDRILFISTGNPIRRERSIPLGFFVAASVFKKSGFEVKCIDLAAGEYLKENVSEVIQDFRPKYIGISVCGFHDYQIAKEVCTIVRALKAFIPIIIGGQHIQHHQFRSDKYVKYISEYIEDTDHIFRPLFSNGHMEPIDYSLVNDPSQYIPSIEISRGCWNNCSFCNSDNKFKTKSINIIEQEIEALSKFYPKGSVLSLGGSNTSFRQWDITGLFNILRNYNSHFSYTFNVGVESDWDLYWSEIAKLNLWALYIGIESVNPEILLGMNKTKDPLKYIKKAQRLVDRCKNDGVYALLTYIYGYPKDTNLTLSRMDEFISNNKSSFLVHCGGPCLAYPGTEIMLNRVDYEKRGVRYIPQADNDTSFYHLDISDTLTYDYLSKRSSEVFRSVNSNYKTHYHCRGIRNFGSFETYMNNRHYYFNEIIA